MAFAIDAIPNGPGQLTFGLTDNLTGSWAIGGLGLNTFGFVWLNSDIWSDAQACVNAIWVCSTYCASCN